MKEKLLIAIQESGYQGRRILRLLWWAVKLALLGLLWVSICSFLYFFYLVIDANSFYLAFKIYLESNLQAFDFFTIYFFLMFAIFWIKQDLVKPLVKPKGVKQNHKREVAYYSHRFCLIENNRQYKAKSHLINSINMLEELDKLTKFHQRQVVYVLPILASFLVLALDRSAG